MHKLTDYDDGFMGDEADWPQNDDWAQNDDGGNDGEGEDNDVFGTIETKPMNYRVKIGTDVRLECQVTPNEGPVVQWDKNGDGIFIGNLKLRAPARYNLDIATRSLLIEHVEPADDGEYTCTVMVKSNASTVTHRLVVLSAPNITHFSASDNGNVIEGHNLTLQCDVTGSPKSSIMWSRTNNPNDGNGRLDEKEATFTSNTATLINVKPEDSGTYYCYALNTEGHAQAETQVNILVKPHAHVHKKVLNTGLGDHAMLQCTAKGNPMPTITWYKGDTKISSDNKRYFISNDGPRSNLTVVPAAEEDFGTYTCVATNSHNKHNRSAELVERPVVEEVDVEERMLSWKLHSHLQLKRIELQLIDEMGNSTAIDIPVPKTRSKSYELKYQMPKEINPGKYQAFIKAKNENGWSRDQSPIPVEIEDRPMYIQRSSVYHGSGSSRISSSCFLSITFIYLLVRMV